jgi:hypothetical protein
MTISTGDQLKDALGNNASRLVIDKASLSNTAAGQYHSLWRANGQPGQAPPSLAPQPYAEQLVDGAHSAFSSISRRRRPPATVAWASAGLLQQRRHDRDP